MDRDLGICQQLRRHIGEGEEKAWAWKSIPRNSLWQLLKFGKRCKPTDSRSSVNLQMINPQKLIPRHSIIKLLETKNKDCKQLVRHVQDNTSSNDTTFLMWNHGDQKKMANHVSNTNRKLSTVHSVPYENLLWKWKGNEDISQQIQTKRMCC